MKKIVISGANGLLGHELLCRLSGIEGNEIYAISRSGLDPSARLNMSRVHVVNASLDQDDLCERLPVRSDVVIHLAQSNDFRNFPEKATGIFDINVNSTLLLLNYARRAGVTQFLYTSTGGVYTTGKAPFTESDRLCFDASSGFYPTSKYCSELLVQNYNAYFSTCIFRPFFIYGPRQKKDMLIPRLLQNVKDGNEIRIEGENGLRINPIYAEDAAMLMMNALEKEGHHVLNLGGSEVLSLRDIVEIIGQNLDKKVNFTFVENAVPRDVYGDITRLRTLLGTPETGFANGIAALLRYEE